MIEIATDIMITEAISHIITMPARDIMDIMSRLIILLLIMLHQPITRRLLIMPLLLQFP